MGTATSPAQKHQALLIGFLAGDRLAREMLPRITEPYMLKLARQLGWDLPEDLQREVVRQAFLNLSLQKPDSYDPTRGSVGTFLKLLVRNATRQVRALYTAPGQLTRIRKPKGAEESDEPGPVCISLDELNESHLPTSQIDPRDQAQARHDVGVILRLAPAQLALSLLRIHVEGASIEDVAAELGVSRFKLARQLESFASEVRPQLTFTKDGLSRAA